MSSVVEFWGGGRKLAAEKVGKNGIAMYTNTTSDEVVVDDLVLVRDAVRMSMKTVNAEPLPDGHSMQPLEDRWLVMRLSALPFSLDPLETAYVEVPQ